MEETREVSPADFQELCEAERLLLAPTVANVERAAARLNQFMDRLRQDGSAPAGVEAERQRLARLHLARLNDLLEAALRIRLSLARVAQAEAAGYHADGRSSAPDLAGRTACLVG